MTTYFIVAFGIATFFLLLCIGVEMTTYFIVAFGVATFFFQTRFFGNKTAPDIAASFPEQMLLQNEVRKEPAQRQAHMVSKGH